MKYLLNARCITAEHQRLDTLSDDDLVSISSAGAVHLEILASVEYLAACAEDMYFGDREAAHRVAQRIGAGRGSHFSEVTVFENAEELLKYLTAQVTSTAVPTPEFLNEDVVENLHDFREAASAVEAVRRRRQALRAHGRLFIGNVFYEATEQDITDFFANAGIALTDVYLPRGEEGSPKGIAFVTLKDPQQLDDAIAKTKWPAVARGGS